MKENKEVLEGGKGREKCEIKLHFQHKQKWRNARKGISDLLGDMFEAFLESVPYVPTYFT